MRLTRGIIAILLFLSALSLSTVPNVQSQSFVTATLSRTNTITQTFTYYSTSKYMTTSTGNSTGNVTFGRLSECYAYWTSFNVTTTTLTVQYTTGERSTVYFFSNLQYYAWINAPTSYQCNPTSFTYKSDTLSSGNFSVNKLSESGNPYAIVFITSELTNPLITFTIGPILILSQIVETTSTQVLSMSTDTISLISLQPLAVSFVQTYGGWIVAVGLAVLGILLSIVGYRRVHHPKHRKRVTRRKSS